MDSRFWHTHMISEVHAHSHMQMVLVTLGHMVTSITSGTASATEWLYMVSGMAYPSTAQREGSVLLRSGRVWSNTYHLL